jgi:hypothetical protein
MTSAPQWWAPAARRRQHELKQSHKHDVMHGPAIRSTRHCPSTALKAVPEQDPGGQWLGNTGRPATHQADEPGRLRPCLHVLGTAPNSIPPRSRRQPANGSSSRRIRSEASPARFIYGLRCSKGRRRRPATRRVGRRFSRGRRRRCSIRWGGERTSTADGAEQGGVRTLAR